MIITDDDETSDESKLNHLIMKQKLSRLEFNKSKIMQKSGQKYRQTLYSLPMRDHIQESKLFSLRVGR